MVDTMLARLTDAEIRALLADELRRRAEERAAAAPAVDRLAEIPARLVELEANIRARLAEWAEAWADIGARRDAIAERLRLAGNGIWGMIAASLAVAAAGLIAARAVSRATHGWRRRLANCGRDTYWDRVGRSFALGLVEFLPIFAWAFVTVRTAPLLSGPLGPMIDYVWIYEVGVAYGWGFLVIARRAFAPDAPLIRINSFSNATAGQIHALVRKAVLIGAGGWLVAGLSPTLGLGYPPALTTVALAGSMVAALFLAASIRNYRRIGSAVADLLIADSDAPSAFARLSVAVAPVALVGYLVFAWLYWIANWIESGQQHLYGPAGTLVVLLALPILDRLGFELCDNLKRADSASAARYHAVFHGGWRMLIGIAALLLTADLWGLDLYGLAKGEMASPWAGMTFDIVITLLIARFVWQLILAALHRDPRVASSGEDGDDEIPAATRLDTLVPLLRNLLLIILAVVVTMILLSSAGVNIGPLLASAGIVGIAIGFGAQALVRDIFSGAFFLVDDAFRVGEYIELDDQLRGEVESISIRSLQLRHHRGPVITIPFGELKNVINHSRDWVIYKMSFRMEPETDPLQVKRIVKAVGKEFLSDPEHGPKFLEPLKSQGVQMIDDDSAQVFRVKFKCRPRAQFVLRREIYHRLRQAFAENGLHFARRKVEVVAAQDGNDTVQLAAASVGDAAQDTPARPAR
ncbi:mechanosensitive ion channel family protein [Limibaculum sp. FT325]|uniref:mechanosensitive ion channel family protein n=1 Tax=Thermohalobaculum sediminis TaxID=2939436 RepID=UPI0020BDAB0C|nr:mechanosensitive ion channel family protein [Limibaculum sediminis]MCL5778072.1 mechanosensitive ion channel family protein [Limibaculum sediminis]